MILKLSDLKKDLLVLKGLLRSKTLSEQERDSLVNQIDILKTIIEDLEFSSECIIES
jgi:hypothetical protein